MPDLVMHHYFGSKLLASLDSEVKAKITNKKLYDFATAGPDPFFFISFWNKAKNKVGLDFGNQMHRHKTRAFFSTLTRIAKNDKKMFSYLCGFIAHYALDVKAHPYIFFKTGVYDATNIETLKYRGLHTKLERAIDTYIIKKEYYSTPHKFKIHKHILKLKKLDNDYKQSFDQLYSEAFNINDGFDRVNKSVIDQRKFYKFIYDPWGLKQKLLTKLDNGKSSLDLKVLSYYHKEITNIDIFNIDKKVWTNPVDNTIKSNLSFFELFDEAITMAIKMINYVFKVVYQNQELDESQIPDLTYIDGLACDLGKPMQYFNNIFEV